YDRTSTGAEARIRFLGIRDEAEHAAHLSEEEARKIKLAEELEQSGLSEAEIRAAINDAKRKKIAQPSPGNNGGGGEQTVPGPTLIQEIEERRPSVKNAKSSGQTANAPPEPV